MSGLPERTTFRPDALEDYVTERTAALRERVGHLEDELACCICGHTDPALRAARLAERCRPLVEGIEGALDYLTKEKYIHADMYLRAALAAHRGQSEATCPACNGTGGAPSDDPMWDFRCASCGGTGERR